MVYAIINGMSGQFANAAIAIRDTQMFNGYGSEVASLYSGMDLRKYY